MVPFLLRCPKDWGVGARAIESPISTPDIMPTILGLSRIAIPATCEGQDLSQEVLGVERSPEDRSALIMCPGPFGQWSRVEGGKEYRGVRTKRYTYVRDLKGPWLLYDNQADPYQLNNLVGKASVSKLQQELEGQLQMWLRKTGDAFLPGPELIRRCGYKVNKNETVDYGNPDHHGQISVSCREEFGK